MQNQINGWNKLFVPNKAPPPASLPGPAPLWMGLFSPQMILHPFASQDALNQCLGYGAHSFIQQLQPSIKLSFVNPLPLLPTCLPNVSK